MSIDGLISLAAETFTRAEWVAIFLASVGAYWLVLGYSGLQLGHTRGFGWRAPELRAAQARVGGSLWAAAGVVCLVSAVLVWVAKA